MNINKTNYTCSHKRQTLSLSYQDLCKLKGDGLQVSRVQVAKFLGVDEKFSWSNHNNAVCKNVPKNISVIYKVKHVWEITTYTCYTVN